MPTHAAPARSARLRSLSVSLLTLSFLVRFAVPARPDVVAPVSTSEQIFGTVVASAEALVVHERRLDERGSLLMWAGLGRIAPISDSGHAWGAEAALELRRYTHTDRFSGPSASSYVGLALMGDSEDRTYVAVTPGVKINITAESPIERFEVEPYFGISYPVTRYLEGGEGASSEEWKFAEGFCITFGMRFMFRMLDAPADARTRSVTR
jgi:hypothetical protein